MSTRYALRLSFLTISLKRQADYERQKGVKKSITKQENNMNDQFTTIASFLAEAGPADLASLTFDDICRRHGASPRRMNLLFYDNFGMSGDEAIMQLTDCI